MGKKTIFCVDDEPEILATLKTGLEQSGFTVVTAVGGEAALEQLKTLTPDLIITDLRMDPISGFEFYKAVRKEPRFATLPFFFLTGIDDFLARKYSDILGADAYITKPFDLDTLEKAIKTKLRLT